MKNIFQNKEEKPELSLASIQPVILRGATWAWRPDAVTLRVATEPDPEVAISIGQLLYVPLYQLLLTFRLNA